VTSRPLNSFVGLEKGRGEKGKKGRETPSFPEREEEEKEDRPSKLFLNFPIFGKRGGGGKKKGEEA